MQSNFHALTPRFNEKEIRDFVLKHYGLQAAVKPLTGYVGQNFRLGIKGGGDYIFKLASQEENLHLLLAQNEVMGYLNEQGYPLRVPGDKPCLRLTEWQGFSQEPGVRWTKL